MESTRVCRLFGSPPAAANWVRSASPAATPGGGPPSIEGLHAANRRTLTSPMQGGELFGVGWGWVWGWTHQCGTGGAGRRWLHWGWGSGGSGGWGHTGAGQGCVEGAGKGLGSGDSQGPGWAEGWGWEWGRALTGPALCWGVWLGVGGSATHKAGVGLGGGEWVEVGGAGGGLTQQYGAGGGAGLGGRRLTGPQLRCGWGVGSGYSLGRGRLVGHGVLDDEPTPGRVLKHVELHERVRSAARRLVAHVGEACNAQRRPSTCNSNSIKKTGLSTEPRQWQGRRYRATN